jgi:hypothetical protein
MADKFAVPKQKVQATVKLAGAGDLAVSLFLAESAAHHIGPERPSDLLAAARFIPVVLDDGGFSFLQVGAIQMLSVPAEAEFGKSMDAEYLAAQDATTLSVEICLDDSTCFTGTVIYLLPEAQRRLQDFLNDLSDQFVQLRDGETIHLINKDHIVRVSPS